MPFTFIDDEQQAAPSSSKFTFLDEGGQRPLKDQSVKEMAQGELKAADQLMGVANTSVAKLTTGKSFFDMTKPEIQPNTSKPFDANVTEASKPLNRITSIARNAQGGMLDETLTPLNIGFAGAGKVEQAVKGAGTAINQARNSIAKAALSPEFSQDASAFKYGHDARRPMQSMPDIIGEDAHATKVAIINKTEETGQAIGDTISKSPRAAEPVGVNEADIAKPFDDEIARLNKADPTGNRRTIRALEAKRSSLLNEFDETGNLKNEFNFDNMTAEQLQQYKKIKLSNIKYTGRAGVDESALNSALQEARHNVVSKMNTHMPEIKALNQDYGDLLAAQDSMDKIIFKAQKEGFPKVDFKNFLPWINNPINRAKMAQWLYVAPQAEKDAIFKAIPQLSQMIPLILKDGERASFGKANPFNSNLEGTDLGNAGEGFAQRSVSREPVADNPLDTGGEARKMEAEGGPATQYVHGKGGSANIQTLRENANKVPDQKMINAYMKEHPELMESWKRKGGSQIGNEAGNIELQPLVIKAGATAAAGAGVASSFKKSEENGKDMTKRFEGGFKPSVYKDTAGHNTIGVGFNIYDPSVRSLIPKDVLDSKRALKQEESDKIFNRLYTRATNDAKSFLGYEAYDKLSPVRKNILNDLSYNLGREKLSQFKLLRKALLRGDFNRAANEMVNSDWHKQVKSRAIELENKMRSGK